MPETVRIAARNRPSSEHNPVNFQRIANLSSISAAPNYAAPRMAGRGRCFCSESQQHRQTHFRQRKAVCGLANCTACLHRPELASTGIKVNAGENLDQEGVLWLQSGLRPGRAILLVVVRSFLPVCSWLAYKLSPWAQQSTGRACLLLFSSCLRHYSRPAHNTAGHSTTTLLVVLLANCPLLCSRCYLWFHP